MSKLKVLLDSGFLVALYAPSTSAHARVRQVIIDTEADFILPNVVLTEVAYLLNREGGTRALVTFLEDVAEAGFVFEMVRQDDLRRVTEIMTKYHPTRFDFVDCALVALAERLNISHICTLDYRDFSILRTKSGNHLTILP
jgi:hypothetical protein